MTVMSVKMQIEQELTTFLGQLSIEELKRTTKKQCRTYLEKKFNKSLSKQKNHIKSFLIEYCTNYMKSSNVELNDKLNDDKHKLRKRKLTDSMEQINSLQPPLKKTKLSGSEINNNNNDNIKKKVKSQVMMISPLESIESIKEMTSLIQADNLISKLNENLTHKKLTIINYDNIEYEALKNKLIKCQQECLKNKELAKQYALLLQPKVIQCENLKKEIEILNKNIQTLNNKYSKQILKLENCLKNESENVKEERYKYLRKEKYVQRIEKKFDFVCNKYNIDKDNVVVEMCN